MNKNYKELAKEARINVLNLIYEIQTSHIGSNFSCIDILTVLYDIANIDKKLKEDRDRIVISKGWIAASIYYFLAKKGIISNEYLKSYCQNNSKYIGLLEPSIRGVEAAGGSMGFGLPFGIGFAFAKKIKKETGRIFVLMGDGEIAIGTTWESALIAAHQKLDNLVVIVDCNKFQAMGKVKEVLNIEPLKKKWESFGWQVQKIDGHNLKQIEKSLKVSSPKGKPMIIIAKTIKGKGVSFMENDNIYHYKAPSEKEYLKALKELKQN